MNERTRAEDILIIKCQQLGKLQKVSLKIFKVFNHKNCICFGVVDKWWLPSEGDWIMYSWY